MKKLFAFILVFFILSIPSYVYSTDGIYFDLEFSGDKIQLNRGFDIYFNAKSNILYNISAIRLDISYDSSKLKFLNVESTAEIDTYEVESGVVRIIWLNPDGREISQQIEKLFTIRFKPLISADNFSYSFSAKILETISYDAEYIAVENIPSITITKDRAISNSSKNTSSKSENSRTESNRLNTSSDSENKSIEESNAEEIADNKDNNSMDISIGDRKSINSENGFTYFILGAGGMLVLIVIVFLAYTLGKKHSKSDK